MLNPIVSKPIIRMAAAALVAGAIAFAITAAPAANDFAPTQAQATEQPLIVAKADYRRVPGQGNACSAPPLPHFEPKGQFDLKGPARAAGPPRGFGPP